MFVEGAPMSTNIECNVKRHNPRRTIIILITLLTVLIVSSLIFAYVVMRNPDDTSIESDTPTVDDIPTEEDILTDYAIHVINEKELVNAVNNVARQPSSNQKPTIIKLDGDIKLKQTFVIPNNKNITLSSNNTNGDNFFKLIGANDCDTITVKGGGVLRLMASL
jgi:hypothetical protein